MNRNSLFSGSINFKHVVKPNKKGFLSSLQFLGYHLALQNPG